MMQQEEGPEIVSQQPSVRPPSAVIPSLTWSALIQREGTGNVKVLVCLRGQNVHVQEINQNYLLHNRKLFGSELVLNLLFLTLNFNSEMLNIILYDNNHA